MPYTMLLDVDHRTFEVVIKGTNQIHVVTT